MMMRHTASYSLFLFILLAAGLLLTSARAEVLSDSEVGTLFESANGDFEANKFEDAAIKYEQLARSGRISAELYFNLGTAKYRLGQSGEAILWMKRALVVDPDMPEARQSLTFLRTRIGFFEFAESRLDRIIGSLPATFGIWATSLAVWISLVLISMAVFLGGLKARRSTLITCAILAAMAAFVFSRIGHYRTAEVGLENFSTITGSGVSALTAPVLDAKAVVDLPSGSEVKILRDSGAWLYAEIPGDLRGWVRSDTIEVNWPIPTPETNEIPDVIKEFFRNHREPVLLAPSESGSGR